ncbi:amidohydrolase family protein [Sphingobium sp. EM0848]|uniref:amidohydrolase family protein n=1 Tax=Sphingobium sp. EM0848 TaxID=2743473 RepID=UPI00159C6A53|nr:amidohydrolase family protein [Sphingobium sp. EM0848]
MDSQTGGAKGFFDDTSLHVSSVAQDIVQSLDFKPISADSHITEPPNTYIDYIDPKYRDIAPHVEKNAKGGDIFVVDRMDLKIGLGGLAAAGKDPSKVALDEATFEELHRGGWDGSARVAAQDRDGVGGEIIYPSVGMLLCNHPDPDYKAACFTAYNRWLQEFQSAAPDRIFGIGQTAVRSVEEAIADFQRIREMGFHGVMMPCDPATEFDYDDPRFDPLWQAAVDLKLPLSFHILTAGRDIQRLGDGAAAHRGKGKANNFHTLIRANQDVISMFIWGRIFERFPDLKLVCVEADAGWAPHFMYRMDHFYNRHRFWSGIGEMPKMPSQIFADNIYLTFQDDFIAFNSVNMMNPRRMLWANDFPHSDSTWPWSQQMLARQTRNLSVEQRRWILRDNVVELYGLPNEDDGLRQQAA